MTDPASLAKPTRSLSDDRLDELLAAALRAQTPVEGGSLELHPDGGIEVVDPDREQDGASNPRAIGQLSPETFASRPSLDEVAQAVNEARQQNKDAVEVNGRPLVVDPNGNFVVGDHAAGGRQIGQLSPETFAGVRREDRSHVDSGRVNATQARAGLTSGWSWSVTTEFGDRFEFFGYWDRTQRMFYTVLGSPRLEHHAPSPHDLHLYRDGVVCLTPGVGCRDLAHAHERSALWARGASCYLAGLGFPFNPGQ